MPIDIARTKDFIDMLQSISTIAALIVGGMWTYLLFIRKRESLPKVTVEHIVSISPMGASGVLLTLVVELCNTGNTLIELDQAVIRVGQVLPMSDPLIHVIRQNTTPENLEGEHEYVDEPWPDPWQRMVSFQGDDRVEIEPGTSQQFNFNFILPEDVRRVRLYTWFGNPVKQKNELGWTKISFADISPKAE